MKFNFEGKKYEISFKYDRSAGGTICWIHIPLAIGTIYTHAGGSRCHVGDNFCREIGRKLALARAVKGEPKDFRRAAWQAYLGRKTKEMAA